MEFVRGLLSDFATFDPEIRRVTRKTLKGSGNLFGSANISTNSVYDDDSESVSNFSNSELYSSASIGQRLHPSPLHRSSRSRQPTMPRSQRIDSEEEDEDSGEEEDKNLYKSDTLLHPPASHTNIIKST